MSVQVNKQVFELKHPFEFRGATYTKFEMRRAKVRDLRNFSKGLAKDPAGAMERVVADLIEMDPLVIAEMDIEDYAPMKAAFEAFLKPLASDEDES